MIFKMIFDIKQAIRSGYSPFEVLDEMKNEIVHVHISDSNSKFDCLPPGRAISILNACLMKWIMPAIKATMY